MNIFGCCKQVQNGVGYQVTNKIDNKKSNTTFVHNLNKISKDQLNSPNTSILKITKSDYDTIAKQFSKKGKLWTDHSFPPNDQSLGVINNVTSNKWKRVSQIIQNPVIFKSPINPTHLTQQQHPDKAFLASLASLAQDSKRIEQIFRDQVYNPNGFYKILLKVKSQIQQILIDDFVPVNQNGEALFAKPHENQIWVLLLQKARAKVYGSYQNLFASNSNPKQIIEQISFAPTIKLDVLQNIQEAQSLKFWQNILDESLKNRAIVAKTGSKVSIDWKSLNLLPNHYYSLLDSITLQNQQKIIKLRNASGLNEWAGVANENDSQFWSKFIQSGNQVTFLQNNDAKKDGIFYMRYTDFIKYFTEICISYQEYNGSYIAQDLFFNQKNGLVHQLQIYNQGIYNISVDESLELKDDGIARTTILLIRKYKQNKQIQYEFVDGVLSTNNTLPLLKTNLTPGTYLIYTKIRSTPQKSHFPKNPHLIIYSKYSAKIQLSSQQHNPNLLKKTFLTYGRAHKRQLFNDDLMWMSWKLFNQGGYGYVAFGNDKDSHDKFVVTFNEEDFTSQGFILKKPYKGKGSNQVIEVGPGEQVIILVTVGNSQNKNRKFPPKLGVNIHPASLQSSPVQPLKQEPQPVSQP